jgi:hypothetical protein
MVYVGVMVGVEVSVGVRVEVGVCEEVGVKVSVGLEVRVGIADGIGEAVGVFTTWASGVAETGRNGCVGLLTLNWIGKLHARLAMINTSIENKDEKR